MPNHVKQPWLHLTALFELSETQTTFPSKAFSNLNWKEMIRCDFSIGRFLRALLLKSQIDIYWITGWNCRLAHWNTRRLEEAGWSLLWDADGATSRWGSKRGKYWGKAFVIYIFNGDVDNGRHNTIRVLLCFVEDAVGCVLVYRVVDKDRIDTNRRIIKKRSAERRAQQQLGNCPPVK
jgi:hypothetical protein